MCDGHSLPFVVVWRATAEAGGSDANRDGTNVRRRVELHRSASCARILPDTECGQHVPLVHQVRAPCRQLVGFNRAQHQDDGMRDDGLRRVNEIQSCGCFAVGQNHGFESQRWRSQLIAVPSVSVGSPSNRCFLPNTVTSRHDRKQNG